MIAISPVQLVLRLIFLRPKISSLCTTSEEVFYQEVEMVQLVLEGHTQN